MKLQFLAALPLILAAAFNVQAQRSQRPGAEGRRIRAGDSLQWSGMSLIDGRPNCSPWLIKHGLAATAKHCFTHAGFPDERAANQARLALAFSHGGHIGTGNPPDIIVPAADIERVIFDSGDNDIAYILYDGKDTEGKITIDNEIAREIPAAGTPMNITGFPGQRPENRSWDRLTSTGCRATGVSGPLSFPDKPLSSYGGTLQDTTCKGWFAVSGGAVHGNRRTDGKVPVYGVVTHTFDVLPGGDDPDPAFIGDDEFGSSSTTNFSPFATARDLDRVLGMK